MALNLRFNKCLCVVSATEISRFIASVPCEISYSQRLSSAVAASEILEAASEACLIFFSVFIWFPNIQCVLNPAF